MSRDPVNELITRFLRHERKKRRMRIVDVAEISGIPTSSYSCLERGRYRLTAESLLRIQIALGCSIEALWPFGNWRVAKVTDEVVRLILEETEKKLPALATSFDITEAVYHVTGIDFDEMASRTIRRPVAEARAVAAYLARHTPEVLMNDLARDLDMDPSSLSTAAT
ncbi:MAG TPA: helix-turn-helix transcriptional regulator, partial [Acidobacteriota bacterium]|nr:helix-turn-helix transcriptional regulator [Acidobacteriota bacterium]